MSFKIVVFVAAVFACEANAQLGGMVRPFATGFANGFNEIAKPMVQFGQSVVSPVSDYFSRVPQAMSQMMNYPAQFVPKPQSAYDRFESFLPGMPGAGYFRGVRPQAQFYQIQGQYMKPARPYPVPAAEQTPEKYRPSSLLVEPSAEVPKPEGPATLEAQFEAPKTEGPATLDAEFDIPTMQRPLPIEEDQQ